MTRRQVAEHGVPSQHGAAKLLRIRLLEAQYQRSVSVRARLCARETTGKVGA